MAKKKKNDVTYTVEKRSIYDIVPKNYAAYGREVNVARSFPYKLDGLKPIYRRIVWTLYKMGGGIHKTVTVQGEVMKIHPHDIDHQVKPISELCHYKILLPQGNHGKLSLLNGNEPPAASRYTEVGLEPKFRNIVKYAINEVEMIDNDSGYLEPVAIPFPVPISLMMDGVRSIGVGIGCQYPTFSMQSMMDALYNNNHLKLKYRGDVKIDYRDSELKKLWNQGEGRVTYIPNTYIKGRSVFVECTPGLITVNFSRNSRDQNVQKVNEHMDQGRIFINDLSDKNNEGLVEIGITKGTKVVDINWLKEVVDKNVISRTTYSLYASDGTKVQKIPLKKWLKASYDNFIELTKRGLENRIKKLEWDRLIYTSIPLVASVLLKNNSMSNEDISKATKLDIEIVKDVMSRSISMIRKSDHSVKIDAIDKQIADLKSIDPDKLIQDNYI